VPSALRGRPNTALWGASLLLTKADGCAFGDGQAAGFKSEHAESVPNFTFHGGGKSCGRGSQQTADQWQNRRTNRDAHRREGAGKSRVFANIGNGTPLQGMVSGVEGGFTDGPALRSQRPAPAWEPGLNKPEALRWADRSLHEVGARMLKRSQGSLSIGKHLGIRASIKQPLSCRPTGARDIPRQRPRGRLTGGRPPDRRWPTHRRRSGPLPRLPGWVVGAAGSDSQQNRGECSSA